MQLKQESILLVEDDAELRLAVAALLQKQFPGRPITAVGSGADAISALESFESSPLVVCDIVLPGDISGIDLWEHCRSKFQETHFLFISGLPEEFCASFVQFSQEKMTLLTKPFSSQSFEMALKSVMRV